MPKAVEERKITCIGQKDILTLALGTLKHPGRVGGNGGKKTQTILQHTKTHKNSWRRRMSKDVKGESKELGRGDHFFESWKKRTPHTPLWSEQHKHKETIVGPWRNMKEASL